MPNESPGKWKTRHKQKTHPLVATANARNPRSRGTRLLAQLPLSHGILCPCGRRRCEHQRSRGSGLPGLRDGSQAGGAGGPHRHGRYARRHSHQFFATTNQTLANQTSHNYEGRRRGIVEELTKRAKHRKFRVPQIGLGSIQCHVRHMKGRWVLNGYFFPTTFIISINEGELMMHVGK